MRNALTTSTVVLLVTGLAANAQFRPGHGPQGRGPHMFPGGPGMVDAEFTPPDLTSEPLSPEQLAQRCIQRMNRIAHLANIRMHVVANVGVNIINNLQENENVEQATTVAENRTNRINHIAELNSDRIQFVVEHCIEVLTEQGASEELIGQVQAVAEEKWTLIEEHRSDETQRIQDALND